MCVPGGQRIPTAQQRFAGILTTIAIGVDEGKVTLFPLRSVFADGDRDATPDGFGAGKVQGAQQTIGGSLDAVAAQGLVKGRRSERHQNDSNRQDDQEFNQGQPTLA